MPSSPSSSSSRQGQMAKDSGLGQGMCQNEMIVAVHDLMVRIATAMRDPGPGAGAHDRLQCRDEAARGTPHLEQGSAPHVDVGLAVRDDDHFLAAELTVQDLA